MAAPQALVQFFEPWSELYANSAVLPTMVVFGHIAALLFGGGLAVTLDRATLRAAREPTAQRGRHLDELSAAHRLVLVGLALSAITGILLFTADVETYFASWIYWTKMGLIVLLLGNGYVMTRVESRLRLAPGTTDESGWATLRHTAAASIVLWFAIALAGVALVNS